jgi:hypothetical protein
MVDQLIPRAELGPHIADHVGVDAVLVYSLIALWGVLTAFATVVEMGHSRLRPGDQLGAQVAGGWLIQRLAGALTSAPLLAPQFDLPLCLSETPKFSAVRRGAVGARRRPAPAVTRSAGYAGVTAGS